MRLAVLSLALSVLLGAAAPAAPPRDDAVANPARWPAASSPAAMTDPATERRVRALLARMTLEEKVGQLIQADIGSITPEDLRRYPLGSVLAGGNSGPKGDDRALAAAWVDLARAFKAAALEPRPGRTPVPLLFGVDAVHGNNNIIGATIFPHNVGLGAARDPDLIRRIGEATAREAAAVGIDWTFAPTLAVPRDDRWGRTYEGYSEDPEIVSAYAGPMTLGLQGRLWPGEPLAPDRIAGSAKHFLADGGTLEGRDQGDARISEAELAAIHAAGYPPAIEAGILTVMASFSSWNGVKHTGNRSLLTDVLKGRMGFDGFVVGDWNAHGQVEGCTNTSCPQAINAGLDMFMAPDSWRGLYDSTLAQARAGTIPRERLDDAVARILRVKLKAGLFGPRPMAGRLEVLGAPEHRALAREAVRKSLVLLKNNGGVLPIRSSARVLVAGDAADDIGQQSGGWTISWQGTGNSNADFPGGTSIGAAIAEAVRAGGGQAELRADGRFTARPDVAVVIFGEEPYAEFQGDLATVEYQPGDKRDLALLRRLKAAGVPVVAVFLSGRPLWTNPEINAADAFVAAWLPGSEGGGVADVLVGDRQGRPRHDFQGRLAFSWPARADGGAINRGDPNYAPLFPFGYGLTYARPAELARLAEGAAANAAAASPDRYFARGRPVPPWSISLIDTSGSRRVGGEARAASPAGVVTLTPADAGGVQEAGRLATWSGAGWGAVTIDGPPVDLRRQLNGDLALAFRVSVDRAPTAPATLTFGCETGSSCRSALDITGLLAQAQAGSWREVVIPLSCFAGADMAKVAMPWSLETAGRLRVSFADVHLRAEAKQACPLPAAQRGGG